MLLCDFSGSDIGALGTLLATMLAAATMLIASRWKSVDTPTIEEWLAKTRYIGLMSKLTAVLQLLCRSRECFAEF